MNRAAVATLLIAFVTIGAPSPRAGQQPAFPAQAQIVWIDASVVDGRDQPAVDLTADDFAVAESGEPRPILAFRAPEPASAIVVLVEDLLTRPQQLPRVRDAVRRLVAGARPGDRVLLAAASGASAQAAAPGDTSAFQAQLDRLRADAERVTRLREPAEIGKLEERRVDVLASALAALAGHAGSRSLVVVGPSHASDVEGDRGARAHERVLRASQLAAAPVYFLACGPDPLSGPAPDARWPDASGGVARDAPLLPTTRPGAGPPQPRLYEAVAADSGGFSASLAWDEAVDRILARSRARYLLGIAAATGAPDGGFRRVALRVNRDGVRAFARRGYFGPASASAPRER